MITSLPCEIFFPRLILTDIRALFFSEVQDNDVHNVQYDHRVLFARTHTHAHTHTFLCICERMVSRNEYACKRTPQRPRHIWSCPLERQAIFRCNLSGWPPATFLLRTGVAKLSHEITRSHANLDANQTLSHISEEVPYHLVYKTHPKIWSCFLVPRFIKNTVNLYSCTRRTPSFDVQFWGKKVRLIHETVR